MRVAICQTSAGSDVPENLEIAERLVRGAVDDGARLACLPEYFAYYGPDSAFAEVAQRHAAPIVEQFRRLAKELDAAISLGSVLEPVAGTTKVANTSILIGPRGDVLSRYRKRHLFDVELPDRVYRESNVLVPGDATIVTPLDDGWRIGASICFDVRFPDHYQALRRQGANLLLAPAAFTALTGKVHWEPLLRARAIETQCCLVAAAQVGECAPGKVCHGHSLIVDPWGQVLACLPTGIGWACADLDLSRVATVRGQIPLFSKDAA